MATWLITGCSSGLGRALAETLIERGQMVYATARKIRDLDALVDGHANATALELDVTKTADVEGVVARVEAEGGVEVVVNNAGYGYLTAFEEGEDTDYRAQFETNMFGLIAMTKAVLPHMRRRGCGHIVNIASAGGLVGYPGSGYYAATKFGVVGLSESLSKEVGALGIKVTVVEPGPFRTEWAGRSLQSSQRPIAAYAETVHARLRELNACSGRQPGDPARAAEAIIQAVESLDPPLNLVLGAIALKVVREKLMSFLAELDRWEDLSLSADYPEQVDKL